MDVDVVKALLQDFVDGHQTTFSEISARESQLLELGALVAVQQHYRSNGYSTEVRSPNGTGPPTFIVKTNTRGHPARYSRVILQKDEEACELHMNLLVRGAHDYGIYCVDVGVVRTNVVPERQKSRERWACVENKHLITFAEVKRLVVYPMLLAQFIGIVHEIKPRFLRRPVPRRFGCEGHLPPSLLTLGHFSGNASSIVETFPRRGITVCIAESVDVRIASHRRGSCKSPLYWDDGRPASPHP